MIRKSLTAMALVAAAPLASAQSVSMCVFDVIGANGDFYNFVKDYALEMKGHGVDFQLKPYTDEGVAIGDFNAGQCDAVAATDIRIRPFNKFTGSISAVGALPTYDNLKTLLATLAQPKAAPLMKDNGYEVLGIIPVGAGYLFVNDRSIDTAGELAGKRMATLDYQKDAIHMVNFVKATVVPSDITNFAGKFNNGVVDVIAAPLVAYNVLELYKGLEPDGGIIDYPLVQLSIQLIAKGDRFPEEMAQTSREYFYNSLDQVLEQVDREASVVDDKWWVDIPAKDKQEYEVMMQDARDQMRNEGHYDPDMLDLLRKVRCKLNSSRAECTGG